MLAVKMHWSGGLKFEGLSEFGHNMVTDGAKRVGGSEDGFKPTELLLYGIASCTGVDVIRILQKGRQKVTGLEIEVIGHQQDEYPKPFHTIEVKYIVRGENLDERRVAKAIHLSESKYCVVSQTVEHPGKVATSYEIVNE